MTKIIKHNHNILSRFFECHYSFIRIGSSSSLFHFISLLLVLLLLVVVLVKFISINVMAGKTTKTTQIMTAKRSHQEEVIVKTYNNNKYRNEDHVDINISSTTTITIDNDYDNDILLLFNHVVHDKIKSFDSYNILNGYNDVHDFMEHIQEFSYEFLNIQYEKYLCKYINDHTDKNKMNKIKNNDDYDTYLLQHEQQQQQEEDVVNDDPSQQRRRLRQQSHYLFPDQQELLYDKSSQHNNQLVVSDDPYVYAVIQQYIIIWDTNKNRLMQTIQIPSIDTNTTKTKSHNGVDIIHTMFILYDQLIVITGQYGGFSTNGWQHTISEYQTTQVLVYSRCSITDIPNDNNINNNNEILHLVRNMRYNGQFRKVHTFNQNNNNNKNKNKNKNKNNDNAKNDVNMKFIHVVTSSSINIYETLIQPFEKSRLQQIYGANLTNNEYKHHIRSIASKYIQHFSQILINDLCNNNCVPESGSDSNSWNDLLLPSMVRLNTWKKSTIPLSSKRQQQIPYHDYHCSELKWNDNDGGYFGDIILVNKIDMDSFFSSSSGIIIPKYQYHFFSTHDNNNINNKQDDNDVNRRTTIISINVPGEMKEDYSTVLITFGDEVDSTQKHSNNMKHHSRIQQHRIVPRQLGIIPGINIATSITKNNIFRIATTKRLLKNPSNDNISATITAFNLSNLYDVSKQILVPISNSSLNQFPFSSLRFFHDNFAYYTVPSFAKATTLRLPKDPTPLYVVNVSNPIHFEMMGTIKTASINRDLVSKSFYPWNEDEGLFFKIGVKKSKGIQLTLYDLSNPIQPMILHRHITQNKINNSNNNNNKVVIRDGDLSKLRFDVKRNYNDMAIINQYHLIIQVDISVINLGDTRFHGYIVYTIDKNNGIYETCHIETSQHTEKDVVLFNGKKDTLPRSSVQYNNNHNDNNNASLIVSTIDNEMIITDLHTCERITNITIHMIH